MKPHSETSNQLSDKVRALPGGEFLELCYSCGTCTSKCMIQQKLEPAYNPRRLIRKAILSLQDEAFEDPTTWLCTQCDICYEACPQEIHISSILFSVRNLALEAGRTTTIHTAKVNEQTCVNCGLCVQVCPYEAIQLVEKKVPYRGVISVAQVDASLCMACGLCGAVCRSTSIGIEENYSDSVLVDSLWQWLNPHIEVFP